VETKGLETDIKSPLFFGVMGALRVVGTKGNIKQSDEVWTETEIESTLRITPLLSGQEGEAKA
jgi:hypothetical protein